MTIKKYKGNNLSHLKKIEESKNTKTWKSPETSLTPIDEDTLDGVKKIESEKSPDEYTPAYSNTVFFGRANNFTVDGLSAYEVAVKHGFVGTEQEWLDSLEGQSGVDGNDGASGSDGLSAYEIAVINGFVGTELEWLNSIVGADGPPGADGVDGASAYEIAIANGFVGSEQDWLDSLTPQSTYSSGWFWIKESTYTSASRFTINPNTLTKVEIKKDLVLSSGVDQDLINQWDDTTHTFIGELNERYELEFTTYVSSTVINQDFSIFLVTENGDNILKGSRITLPSSAGTEIRLTFQFDLFIGSIVLPDGLYFGISSDQTLRIWESSIQVHRSYSP